MNFTVRKMPDPIVRDSLNRLSGFETVLFGHFLNRGVLDPGIQPVGRVRRTVGRAITLSLPAQDSTLLHHAASLVGPGDVVVIDRRGDTRHACLGGGVATALMNSGVSGVVIDGGHTDESELVAIGLPVWSRGGSALTTRIQGLGGALNVPVCAGGVPILPGDAILADENGVVSLHIEDLDAALDRADDLRAITTATIASVETGVAIGEVSGASELVFAAIGERARE